MRQEEAEIVEVLDKCRRIIQKSPQLYGLSPNEVQASDFKDDIFCYWGVVAYLYVKEIDSFSYDKLVYLLEEIRGNGCTCNYVAYILQKEHAIRMVKLFIEASPYGKSEQVIPFVEDNLLYESSVELEEVEDFLTAIYKNKCQQSAVLLSDYAKLVCIMHKQEDIFKLFMKSKEEIYFDFMHYFCREIYQINSATGDRMLLELLQIEQDGAEGIAVDFLDISIYYGCQIFEQYFGKIQNWMQKNQKLREKLIYIYIVYLKKVEKEDLRKDIIAELEKIPLGSLEEKLSFLRAILSRDPLPEYLKQIFEGILLHPFEKNGEVLKLLCRFFSVQKNMDDAEILQYLHQIYIVNGYGRDYQNFFSYFTSILHEMKDNPRIVVDYFMKSMITCGVENLFFALGLYKIAISANCIADNLQEREINVPELSLILRGFLYFTSDEKSVCQISYELARIIPEAVDAEPYLAVCMDEVYENYCHTYFELAKQQGNCYGKWGVELTKRILKRYQEYTIAQKAAYDIPDLKPSIERVRLLRKAKLEQNKEIKKRARKKSFFATMFSNHGSGVMKYGYRLASIQYTKRDSYSYLVAPYARIKSEREIPHIYINDPVKWVGLCDQYLKERDQYCEINH